MRPFEELKRIFEILHGEGGCRWDKAQTCETLLPLLREEVDEWAEAVASGDFEHMKEELGDVLLHVMFAAQLMKKDNAGDIDEVVTLLCRKLKHRHPHVFAGARAGSEDDIIARWEKIKEGERKTRSQQRRNDGTMS